MRGMFQSFDAPSATRTGAARVAALRQLMGKLGLDAVLVPRADEYQSEYVPPSADRLRWLSGFSGSAGRIIITRDAAALFVDGRYVLQAPGEVDTAVFEIAQVPQTDRERLDRTETAEGWCDRV